MSCSRFNKAHTRDILWVFFLQNMLFSRNDILFTEEHVLAILFFEIMCRFYETIISCARDTCTRAFSRDNIVYSWDIMPFLRDYMSFSWHDMSCLRDVVNFFCILKYLVFLWKLTLRVLNVPLNVYARHWCWHLIHTFMETSSISIIYNILTYYWNYTFCFINALTF